MTTQHIKMIIIFGVIAVIALYTWGATTSKSTVNQYPQDTAQVEHWEDALLPVDSIYHESQNHIHGIGFDSQNNRLFIATHFGLFVMVDDQLYQIGNNRDDFMGFSLNQREPNVIYTSGHPSTGGNLGVMKSANSGLTFEQISRVSRLSTVDFHSMAISYANPNILYGVFQGELYRTIDSGYTWEQIDTRGAFINDGFCWHAPCLTADTQDESVIYAGTLNGLAVSSDYGESWELIDNDTGGVVSAVVDPQDNQRIFAFTENHGVAVSLDSGLTWEPRNNGLQLGAQELVFAFSFDTNDSDKLYLATTGQQIYMTQDGGENWEQVI